MDALNNHLGEIVYFSNTWQAEEPGFFGHLDVLTPNERVAMANYDNPTHIIHDHSGSYTCVLFREDSAVLETINFGNDTLEDTYLWIKCER